MRASLGTSKQLVAEVAANVGYSVPQTRRHCVEALGEPLGSFVTRLRLERAAGTLAADTLPIREISRQAGYRTQEAFAKAFHAFFDCSPSQFRHLNATNICMFPGYLLSIGKCSELPKNVRIKIGVSKYETFLYDGPVFLGRFMPNGSIDWRLPRRWPSQDEI